MNSANPDIRTQSVPQLAADRSKTIEGYNKKITRLKYIAYKKT